MAGTTRRNYRRQQQQPRRSVLLRTLLVLLVAVFSSSGNRYGCQSMTVDAMNPASEAAITALHSFDYRYFVAGGTCAAVSHGITTPIDVVKTKLQADPKVRSLLYGIYTLCVCISIYKFTSRYRVCVCVLISFSLGWRAQERRRGKKTAGEKNRFGNEKIKILDGRNPQTTRREESNRSGTKKKRGAV